jgi:gliding motility-associated-like protein
MQRPLLLLCFIVAFCLCYTQSKAQTISAGAATAVAATTYGTASAASSFTVSGTNLSAGITVTPPAGFEVSADNITFNSTAIIGSAGIFTNKLVYIRLSALANAGTYGGNIALSSAGAATVNVVIPNSTVTPAPLTIAAIDVTKPYGTVLKDFTGSGVFTITSGSLKNGDIIDAVTITYGAGADARATVGTYTGSIVPTNAGNSTGLFALNYTVTYVPAKIIITQALLTIQVNNISKTYGDNLTGGPGFTSFTPVGLVNFETIGSITATYSAGNTPAAATGNYSKAITGSAATGGTFIASNYIITYLKGDVTVKPATLTVTADDKNKVFGAANPALTFIYKGFVNNETELQLTSLPTITTTALTTSIPGNYPITVSGASATNYIFVYVPGTLTISPAPLDPLIVLTFPNSFTPNGDGINDNWELTALAPYPNCTVNIYNRYGSAIFTSIGYGIPWDGKYKGANVPDGTYYYIINAHHNNVRVASGSVTVIR